MKNGIKIGKIFGINIEIDWSWLLIFILVSWSLASTFGQIHTSWRPTMRWAIALLAAFIFFGSVVTHELAHALIARARGIPVRNIILFLFGGVSNIQKEPQSPFGELAIAVVGPLTSLVLGAIFLLLGAGNAINNSNITNTAAVLSQFGPLDTLLIWLGSVNILVGLFNLIPGFPLDGGRIVRSVFWAITDDLTKATHWAARMGQAVAWILIFAGMAMLFGVQIPFLGAGFINGIWLIFIGWFLQNAAVNSYRKVVIQDILEDIPVKQMMYPNVPIVQGDSSVAELVDNHILETDNRAFIVQEDERLIGMVTIKDVSKVKPTSRSHTTVKNIMTPSNELIVVAPEEGATDAFYRLQNQNIRQLPVVTGDNIVGLLRRKDIIRWLQIRSQLG